MTTVDETSLTPEDLADVERRVAVFKRIFPLLQTWQNALQGVRPGSTPHLCAGLADIYGSAVEVIELVDRLVTIPADERENTADVLVGLGLTLDHIRWHTRSCRNRLGRLADDLYPDDDEDDDEALN